MNSALNGSDGARRSAGRPVIGISTRTAPVTLRGSDLTVSLALQAHVDLLAAAGCVPVLVPPLPGGEHIVGRLDGLLVPGGPDVSPGLYGASPHPGTRAGGPAMDAAELALIEAALEAGLPFLGICRGMQLLNVQRGGTLHQHLPDVTGDDAHCPATPAGTLGRHRLELEPGSRIAGILGDTAESSCQHHQAVDRVGAGLAVTARAAGGVIEAVEAVDHPFAVGVQWEAGQTPDPRLHRALAHAAGSNRNPQGEAPMPPRMTNPSLAVPDALQPLLDLSEVINRAGVPQRTLDLVRLRTSQINGRVYVLPPDLGKDGKSDGRLPRVADWRDSSGFDGAERAALALAEAAARLGDREDPVPGEVWDEAVRHYDDEQLGALIMQIGLVTLWNCVNVVTRQEPADWR